MRDLGYGFPKVQDGLPPDGLPMPSGSFCNRHGVESAEILLRPSRCRSFKTSIHSFWVDSVTCGLFFKEMGPGFNDFCCAV